jgi:hypothetical protein
MDTNKIVIAQLIDLTNTDAALAQEVRKEVRSLEDNELVLVGGGESIPNW